MNRIDFYGFLGVGIGLAVGIIGHELAHGWAAIRLGDPTPRMTGRMTIKLKPHVDPIGTLILPGVLLVATLFRSDLGFFFGWCKPISTHPSRFRNPRRDGVLFALAGPAFNLAVAGAAAIAYRQVTAGGLAIVLGAITIVNSFLFVLNLFPIPPLDGSRILARFLSPTAAMKMEELSQYFILFLVALFLLFRGLIGNMAAALYEPLLGFNQIGNQTVLIGLL